MFVKTVAISFLAIALGNSLNAMNHNLKKQDPSLPVSHQALNDTEKDDGETMQYVKQLKEETIANHNDVLADVCALAQKVSSGGTLSDADRQAMRKKLAANTAIRKASYKRITASIAKQ